MRIALDIKNLSKLKEPTTNDIIIYDGHKWYVTTKDDILREANTLLAKCQSDLEQIKRENLEFKQQTSKNIVELSETVKKILELKGENL